MKTTTRERFSVGERVRILPLDYLKPCLQGKTGTVEDVTPIPRQKTLYGIRLDHPDPIGCPVVEAGEFERLGD